MRARPRRGLTRTETAALTRALELANLTLAHLECIRIAVHRAKPERLRRQINKLQHLLRGRS